MVGRGKPLDVEARKTVDANPDFDLGAWIDERVGRAVERRLAELGVTDEWLTVAEAAEVTKLGEWHVRQLIKRLQARDSTDVYQPNPGRPPVRIKRSALRDLHAT